MVIKARFTEGVTSVTTKSLYQWDYGQKLEIESADLPAMFEVHFACQGMKEAVVVPCSTTDGVGVVTIPNKCLEQSSTITAWVYEIDGETGSTTKVIAIPVVPRVRPSGNEDMPQHIEDKYTELLSRLNDALTALESGNIVVAKAAIAETADYATASGNAASATHATEAQTAVAARDALYSSEAVHAQGLQKLLYHEKFEEPVTSVTLPNAGGFRVDGLYVVVLIDTGGMPRTQLVYTGSADIAAASTDLSCLYARNNNTISVTSPTYAGIIEIFRIFEEVTLLEPSAG